MTVADAGLLTDAAFWADVAFWLALLPVTLSAVNLLLYRRLPGLRHGTPSRPVSLLVPARNEEANIEALVRSALASRGVDLEVVVLDDHSTDATASIVGRLADADPRVRLEAAPPLPPGWSGKQHACLTLARHARHDLLVFVDADVTLGPDALARIARAVERRDVDLLSGFPRQVTPTLGEVLTVPNILVLLLGYLPMLGERLTGLAGFAAGCGQLTAVRRRAYERVGGHGAVRTSLHDGITLPRAFRRAGLRTRLFDGADLASCRMYRSFKEAWFGFAKNATEGMATPVGLPIWTVLLLGGHVLPFVLAALGLLGGLPDPAFRTALLAAGLILLWRGVIEWRTRGTALAVLLHPLGIAVTLAIQVYALARRLAGGNATWRGRAYPSA